MSPHSNWQRHSPPSDQSSRSSSRPSDSNSSYQSQITVPSEYSYRPHRPDPEICYTEVDERPYYEADFREYDDARASVDTYASTVESEEDAEDDLPPFDAPEYSDYHPCGSDAIPSTPRDFAELFPTASRLSICHDDATTDGNMNLRVDTQVELRGGIKRPMTLFHLRMNDLKAREFSLRRYCRESGREVCHSVRKYQKPATERRPTLQKSLSSALWGFRHKAQSSTSSDPGNLKRQDSGYASMYNREYDRDEEDDDAQATPTGSRRASLLPTNTIKLEFSNYAHVDVKRRGAGSRKRYDFEYWGVDYTWKRSIQRRGEFEEVSYHLYGSNTEHPLAHIVPDLLTSAQTEEENAKGGWVPSCSLWLTDESVINGMADISDVVVATGLMALVDDSIKRRWHSRRRRLLVPLSRSTSFRMNMEYIGPKRLIDEVFNRSPHRPAPDRKATGLHRSFDEA